MPYALLLGLIATVWSSTAEEHRVLAGTDGLFWVHALLSVLTYAAATLAAISGVTVLIQQHALKSKHPTRFSRSLPALTEADALQRGFLLAAGTVLAIGIATGMAIRLVHHLTPLPFDHKTVLSLAAFLLIGSLLFIHSRSGLRGQRAARLVLAAYLLLTLGYPGVKFVSEVLLGQ
jgi:ABC-type uncharacterized transport system permease subunit